MTQQSNGSNTLVQGRIVWVNGDLFAGKPKVNDQKQPIMDASGNQVIEYGFGLAVPKTDANGQPSQAYQTLMNEMQAEALTLYPSGQVPPQFSWKYKDGDGVDHNGKSFADREGYAGHVVLACTTRIPIKYFLFQGGNNILTQSGIKNGDYVTVQLNIKAHPPVGQGKPGLYLNPSAVQLLKEGPEIINTPSGDQIFGTQVATYTGTMLENTAPAMPQMPAQQPQMPAQQPQMPAQQPQMPAQQPQMPAQQPQMPAQQPQMPAQGAPVQPNYGVLPDQMQPQMPAQQPQMPAQQPAQGMQMNNGMPNMPGMPQ